MTAHDKPLTHTKDMRKTRLKIGLADSQKESAMTADTEKFNLYSQIMCAEENACAP